jgi:hypothetical protein
MSKMNVVTIIRKRALSAYHPGDIGQPLDDSTWFECCPQCGCIASLSGWQVIEHEDQTITINPSILCHGCSKAGCGAHSFVEHNRIRWV